MEVERAVVILRNLTKRQTIKNLTRAWKGPSPWSERRISWIAFIKAEDVDPGESLLFPNPRLTSRRGPEKNVQFGYEQHLPIAMRASFLRMHETTILMFFRCFCSDASQKRPLGCDPGTKKNGPSAFNGPPPTLISPGRC